MVKVFRFGKIARDVSSDEDKEPGYWENTASHSHYISGYSKNPGNNPKITFCDVLRGWH